MAAVRRIFGLSPIGDKLNEAQARELARLRAPGGDIDGPKAITITAPVENGAASPATTCRQARVVRRLPHG